MSRPPFSARRPDLAGPRPAAPALRPLLVPLAAALMPLAAGLALTLGAAPAGAHEPSRMGGHDFGPGHAEPASPPTVSVTGSGQKMVAPDVATVSVGVTAQAPTAAQAMSDNATRQRAVIDAAKALGMAPEDLQTQGLSLSPLTDYSREGQPPVITGYQAQNIVTVRVRDLTRLGQLLDSMIAAGATDVQGVLFDRQDASQASDSARGDAVTDARRRAEVMARAAGMELGPLLSMSESVIQPGPIPMMAMARDAKSDSVPVEAGQLALSAQVYTVWALRPAGAPDQRAPWHEPHHGPKDAPHHGPEDGPKGTPHQGPQDGAQRVPDMMGGPAPVGEPDAGSPAAPAPAPGPRPTPEADRPAAPQPETGAPGTPPAPGAPPAPGTLPAPGAPPAPGASPAPGAPSVPPPAVPGAPASN